MEQKQIDTILNILKIPSQATKEQLEVDWMLSTVTFMKLSAIIKSILAMNENSLIKMHSSMLEAVKDMDFGCNERLKTALIVDKMPEEVKLTSAQVAANFLTRVFVEGDEKWLQENLK